MPNLVVDNVDLRTEAVHAWGRSKMFVKEMQTPRRNGTGVNIVVEMHRQSN